MKFSVVLLKNVLLAALLTVLIQPGWGYYESFIVNLLSGYLTEGPFTDFYIYGMEPMGYFIGFLHRLYQPAPWMAVVFIILFVLSISLFEFSVLSALPHDFLRRHRYFLYAVFTGFTISVYWYSWVYYSLTSISIQVSASALLTLWRISYIPLSRLNSILIAIALSLLCVVGYCIRIEGGLGATLFTGIFVLCYQRSVIKTAKIFLVPAIFIMVFFARFYYVYNGYPFLKQIEPLIFYVTDSKYKPPVTANSQVDSIKIQAIRRSFFNDTANLNLAYYQYLAQKKIDSEKSETDFIMHAIRVAYQTAGETLRKHYLLLLLYIFSFAVIVITALTTRAYKSVAWIVLLNVSLVFIFIFLAYLLKMEEWHFIPLTQLCIIFNTIFFFSILGTQVSNNKPVKGYAIAATCLLAVFSIVAISAIAKERNSLNLQMAKHAKALKLTEQLAAGKILFIDMESRFILNKRLLELVKFEKPRKVVMYDLGQLSMLPQYKAFLDKLCNCNSANAGSFFTYVQNHSNDILFVSTGERLDLISTYVTLVYKQNLQFEETHLADTDALAGVNPNLRYFVVKQNP